MSAGNPDQKVYVYAVFPSLRMVEQGRLKLFAGRLGASLGPFQPFFVSGFRTFRGNFVL